LPRIKFFVLFSFPYLLCIVLFLSESTVGQTIRPRAERLRWNENPTGVPCKWLSHSDYQVVQEQGSALFRCSNSAHQ